MSNKKDILFLYTVNFPYGNSEPYLFNELPYLSKHFKKVVIIPLLEERSNTPLPENVEVRFMSEIKNLHSRKIYFVKNFFGILHILLNEFWNCKPKLYFLKKLHYYFSELLNAIELSDKIILLAESDKGKIIHYSFWMNSWALALAFLKKKENIEDYIFRVHGFDLYKERWPHHFIPFRHTCYKFCSGIFPISKLGEKYIKENFTYAHKSKTFYLGTANHGVNPRSTDFHIVSCSNFVPLKRLNLIAQALSNTTERIKWTHIGSYTQSEMTKLKPLLDKIPANVEVCMKGHLSQTELIEFYRQVPISFFINVSESEGIPVSMMEAISFEIPILATNVGAVHEIVTPDTGVLISRDITPQELMKAIINFKNSDIVDLKRKNEIKRFWHNNFSGEFNFTKFCEYLLLVGNNDKKAKEEWNKKYKVSCKKCVLDSTDDPLIEINAQGVCNYCLTYEREYEAYMIMTQSQKEEKLLGIAKKIKSNARKSNYDCLIGVSGGVDSSFVAVKAHELGLKALLIHFDNGWNSELAVKNIEQICRYTGFDLYTYVVDWEEFKDLQKSYIKAGVLDWEVPTDHGLWAITIKKAKELKIKYVLTGFNYQTEGTLPKPMRFDKGDLKNLKDIYKHFGSRKKLKSFPMYNFWQHQFLKLVWGLKIEPILCLLDYNKSESKKYLIDKIGWKDYGGKHYESIFTRFYQGYALKVKFGVDKRKAHLSSMICSGQITREEALMELERPIIDPEVLKEDFQFFIKKMDFSEDEFNQYMSSKPVAHENYRSYSSFEYPIYKFILPKLVRLKHLFKLSKN